ncbi:MAG: FAD-binding protein [Desulfobacterales bacterium]|nr:FAD-binding protein [Desulfobacterales bacterium]
MAMAYRAGAAVANMEFFQFHPTCLYHPQAKSLPDHRGAARRGRRAARRRRATPSWPRYDPRAELAPRDIVARAIDAEMKRTAATTVPARHHAPRPRPSCVERFPNIYERCREFGIDIARQPHPGGAGRALHAAAACVTDLDGAHRRCRASTRSARWPAPACTAPTASPRNSLLEGAGLRGTPPRRRRSPRLADAPGRRRHRRPGTPATAADADEARGDRAQLGRDPALDVELRRHRAHATSGSSARRTRIAAAARGDPRVLLELPRHARPASSCATSPPSPSW